MKKPFSKIFAQSIVIATAFGAGAGQSVFAQDDESDATLEEITVTGTRIRRDDFSNPQPTTVIGSEMMEDLGIVNLGDVMRNLPSNVSTNSPTSNPGGNFFNGSNIVNLRGLNPFFGSRTLTLVDSRRHVPTNQGDGVDLNFIPSILVSRMEVVTGGASASYGSGAVGGVNNIILDNQLDGFKVQLDYGDSTDSDLNADDTHYAFAWGGDVGNGHLVVGFEGQDMSAIDGCVDLKDWCNEGHQIVANPSFVLGGTEPAEIHVRDQRDNLTATGNIAGVGFFDATGTTLSPFNQPVDGTKPFQWSILRSDVERQAFFAHYDMEISESLNFFVEGSFGSVETRTPQGSFNGFGGVSALATDNFYAQNLAGGNPCLPAGCTVFKDFSTQSRTENHTKTDLTRVVFGFDGVLGDSEWTWEAYYQYGESDRQQDVLNNRNLHQYSMAIDAVDDGFGNVVCRVTRDGLSALPNPSVDPSLANGCMPLNIFGNTLTLADPGMAYAFGQLKENTVVEQQMLEGVLSGPLFDGFGAGEVVGAFGLSWRDESIDNIPDGSQTNAQRTDYIIQFGEAFSGDVEVLEAFAEIDVPIIDTFGLNFALRQSEYENTAGPDQGISSNQSFDYSMTTWKIRGNWDITDWVTMRGSVSEDARAPNFRELYYGQFFPLGNPFATCENRWQGGVDDPCEWLLSGGLTLEPESAETQTFGFVFTPDIIPIRLAVDWFKVELEDRITPASVQGTIDACFEVQDPFSCSRIVGDLSDPGNPLGGFDVITRIEPAAFNSEGYEVTGYDWSVDWTQSFDFGVLSMRLIATRTVDMIFVQPGGLVEELSGVNGNTNGFLPDIASAPDWTTQWITTYMNGPLTLTAMNRWISDGKIFNDRFGPTDGEYDASNQGLNSIDRNHVGSYSVWTLSGSYAFDLNDVQLELFGAIDNAFDRDPPLGVDASGFGGGINGTNATYYDTVGRRFRIGVRANF